MRYLVSLKGYLPRSTILYPTLAGEAADQAVRLKDPALGDKRARKADGAFAKHSRQRGVS
jgi:hypothetical protein